MKHAAALIGFLIASVSVLGQDYKTLYKELNSSVITIKTEEVVARGNQVGTKEGLGTGVIIDSTGLAITASHVVHTANKITVNAANGQRIPAEVVSSIPGADVALIKLRYLPRYASIANLGDSDEVLVGEEIFVIGAPLGLEHTLSIGHISGKMQQETIVGGRKLEFLQTDAIINKGNSGGPVFNQNGEVIGIVSFIFSERGEFNGLGFAVASNSVKNILLDSNTFWTGFEGIFLEKQVAEIFNVPQTSGVLVQRVIRDSLADEIGLKGGKLQASILGREIWLGGDIILSIQGISCNSPHELEDIREQLNSLEPGSPFTMSVLRGGEVIDLIGNLNQ